VDICRKLNAPQPVLVLSEMNELTRETLKTQLQNENITPAIILNDATELQCYNTSGTYSNTLLALVDPFVLNPEEWQPIASGLSKLRPMDGSAIIEVFTYVAASSVAWPPAPSGFEGPVAFISRDNYHLAVYCSTNIHTAIANLLSKFGWEVFNARIVVIHQDQTENQQEYWCMT